MLFPGHCDLHLWPQLKQNCKKWSVQHCQITPQMCRMLDPLLCGHLSYDYDISCFVLDINDIK